MTHFLRYRAALLLGAILVLCGLAVPAVATVAMYRADAEHTGLYDDGGSRPNGHLAWIASTVNPAATIYANRPSTAASSTLSTMPATSTP